MCIVKKRKAERMNSEENSKADKHAVVPQRNTTGGGAVLLLCSPGFHQPATQWAVTTINHKL